MKNLESGHGSNELKQDRPVGLIGGIALVIGGVIGMPIAQINN